MGKKTKLKNKEALEFILVNRGMDDPNFQNPDVPSRILLHVPKDEDELNEDHAKILDSIPEECRGVYSEQTITNNLRELGIENIHNDFENNSELKNKIKEINKSDLAQKVTLEMMKNKIIEYENISKQNEKKYTEEIVDTTFNPISLNKEKLENLSEAQIDKLLKSSKITAEITEYNKYGLKSNINPEVLEYVTDKPFQEGVDIFIPAPNYVEINENRYDIDIDPKDMDEEYKEVFDAMNSDNEDNADDLEDDFVLIANEGKLPIEIEKCKQINVDEAILAQTEKKKKNEPSYKYITKQEQEFLDKQYSKAIKEYDDVKPDRKKHIVGIDKMKEAVDELLGYDDNEDFEDYEYVEDEEDEDCEDIEDEEKDLVDEELNKKDKDGQEFKVEYFENNFKIEDCRNNQKERTKDQERHVRPKVQNKFKNGTGEEFTLDDLNKLIHDDNFMEKTVQLFENKVENKEEDEEGLPVYYPKTALDITSVHGKIGNLPKKIGIENIRPEMKKRTEAEKEGKKIIIQKPIIGSQFEISDKESKEHKKLRKKLIKEEKKENRKHKKELKEAFKSEKCKQMKLIANMNQTIRYGLSVKDV